MIADGQIIDVSGSGTELGFLGAGAFGAASGTGTITYADGSTQTYSVGMADWYNNTPVAGDQIATTTSSWNWSSSSQVPHPVSIYYASVPLESGKTVKSVTRRTTPAEVRCGCYALVRGPGQVSSGGEDERLDGLLASAERELTSGRPHPSCSSSRTSEINAALSRQLPDNAILSSAPGSAANWYARQIRIRRGMKAMLSGNLATMVPGVPYAIAAKFAFGGRVSIAMVGDGAMQMGGMAEIQPARQRVH